MKVIHDPLEMQQLAKKWRKEGYVIGLVPTMGFLHNGHLSLIKKAKAKADKVVVSIFVNPTQFGPNEDLDSYPRDFEHDKQLCEAEGVAAVFHPEPKDMYVPDHSTWVTEDHLSDALCGLSRPCHFRGVTTVVSKLFNIVCPDYAVFGQKDAQQALIITRMVRDLNFPVELIIAPIVREADGLALSSRNKYLSLEERQNAVAIQQSLKDAQQAIANGVKDVGELKKQIMATITQAGGRIDYVEFVSRETIRPVTSLVGKCMIAVATYFGTTRLIDNVFIDL